MDRWTEKTLEDFLRICVTRYGPGKLDIMLSVSMEIRLGVLIIMLCCLAYLLADSETLLSVCRRLMEDAMYVRK